MAGRANFWREPIVHFIVAGALLFAVFSLFGEPAARPADERTIVVDRRALLTYMQYRANAFDPEAFDAALDSMAPDEIDALIEAYVNEEMLYREALAYGLADSDYIIRQRMVQKMSFLLGDLADAGTGIDEAELERFFRANEDLYVIEPSVTFTHVFFDTQRRGEDAARNAARESLAALNAAGAGFNDTAGHGDRFVFLKNYVDRTFDFVASHFGTGFTAELAKLEPSAALWHGPIRSPYGLHLVLVTERTEARIPRLEEVRPAVEADYLRRQSDDALEEMTGTLRETYDIVVTNLDTPVTP